MIKPYEEEMKKMCKGVHKMKNRIKGFAGIALSIVLIALAGCAGKTSGGTISVVSREDGSGTRGAFIELFGIEQKDADGNKIDHTTDQAEITNSTAVMQQAARISDRTAFFLLGEIVEYGDTEQVFSLPRDKRTEDYITGRFG